jgi:hypothetical protein
MPEEIIAYRGFCDWLIAFTHCPCNRAAPDPVACLGVHGVDIAPKILLPKSRPRAARRRRSRRSALGKSADPDGGSSGDGPRSRKPTQHSFSNHTGLWRPQRRRRGERKVMRHAGHD